MSKPAPTTIGEDAQEVVPLGHELKSESTFARATQLSSACATPRRSKSLTTRLQVTLPDAEADYDFPEGGLRAWIVVLGTTLAFLTTWGFLNGSGALNAYWAQNQLAAYSTSSIGWLSSVNVCIALVLGIQVGPIFDVYGPKWLMGIGSVMYVVAWLLLAQSTQYWQFMLTFGVLTGGATSLIITPAISAVSHWFSIRRGTANCVFFVGSSVGGFLYPILLRAMFGSLGWTWTIRTLAMMQMVQLIIAYFCVRSRLPPTSTASARMSLRAFEKPNFAWITAGTSALEFGVVGFSGILPILVLHIGFDDRTATNSIMIFNVGGIIGRLVTGFAADKVGRFNLAILSLVVATLSMLPIAMVRPKSLATLYLSAILFGAGAGSAICLAAVCLGQLCKTENYGQYSGTLYAAVSIGNLVSVPICGELLDAIGVRRTEVIVAILMAISCVCFVMARQYCIEDGRRWLRYI